MRRSSIDEGDIALVGTAVALALAISYPLGCGAVVLVTGAMLIEPIFLRRPPGGDDGPTIR
jgi:hypothetical protein